MDQPPRGLNEPMFGRRVLTIAFLQGASVLATVFCVYLWSILTGHADEVVRSLTFAALVVGNVALILTNRSWGLSIWRSFKGRSNRTLYWILALAATLLVVLLTVPGVRGVLHFGAISWTDIPIVFVAGLVGIIWFEVYKAVTAAKQRRHAD
jgi:Ca2+-transporting ATPase